MESARRYHVTFPVFAKVDVNGPSAHPVFNFLKTVLGPGAGDAADWNFNKVRFWPPFRTIRLTDIMRFPTSYWLCTRECSA